MEHITLSLSESRARISVVGAELNSFKTENREYIWQANPAVWGRHAPILFPIVGKLRNNRYTFQGITYEMGQHGFARDREFSVVKQSASEVTMILRGDEYSKAMYPFDFELLVTYCMQPSGIRVTYEVLNTQLTDPILFSIGGHPGFVIPVEAGDRLEDYEVNFYDPQLQGLEIYPLVGGYVSKEKTFLPVNMGILELKAELFEQDALIMDVSPAAQVSIRSKKTGKGVGMSYADFRWLGIWTKEPGAGFICIEPWNGIADTADHDQKLETKWGIITLEAGKNYHVSYDVMIFQ